MVLYGCFYWLFIFVKRAFMLKKTSMMATVMSNKGEFFAEMHAQNADSAGYWDSGYAAAG